MGVRGLTTYINGNQDTFLRRHYLRDCNLVIDGHSLCSQLYRCLNCFSAFGGDYDKFASYTRTFFKSLRKCNVQPFVLFDGSYELRKLKTAYNRLRSKINGASRLDPVTQSSLQIFPLLLRDVFKEVLIEMMVPYTTCEFEADDEIAAMARYLNCPVLSYDSDFFIYNVQYIPFNTLERKPKQVIINNDKVYVMECKIYKVEYLVANFGGLKEELLPLLATLLGNDFVEKRVFNKFFSQLKLQKSRINRNEQQRNIHSLFKWLQDETLDSAISKILGRIKKDRRTKVLSIITKSINGYNRKHCLSLKYFNLCNNEPKDLDTNITITVNENEIDNGDQSDNEQSDDSSSTNNENTNSDDQNLNGISNWLAEYIRLNRIPRLYINLFTHQLYFSSPQAEDYSDEDASLWALPILRYVFDVLTDFSHENFVYVSRENNCNYKRLLIDREYSISRLIETPFNKLNDDELKKCFYHFLEQKMPSLDCEVIEFLPPNFQLYMISILWWISNCSVPLAHVHSLIITYIFLDAIDEKIGTFRGHSFFNNKHSKKLEELRKRPDVPVSIEDELFLNKHKIQYEDCLLAASVLLKHFEIDDSIRKRPKSYDVKKIHSFAQFQSCLLQFNGLNTLCGEPFKRTIYSKCYNGTFIYNIALKLENQDDPIHFFEQYIKGATSVLTFYKSLCHLFNKCLNTMNLTTVKWSNRKRRSRRKKKEDEDIKFIVEGFESHVVI
ncbi:PREDICTED: protein asteroid [Papilio polytes]|uniref:protein asteroid n=1 Tax=Papilio polytes TaxID=76194 RepID=UPI00067693B5|nr:PREDICTED: protein asteroid [Papilio polytes]